MKKTLLSLLLILGLAGAQAQVGSDFGINMFTSVGGGLANYKLPGRFAQGGFFSMSAGKWILRPLAVRVGFDWAQTHSPIQLELGTDYKSSYFFGSVDFLWDIPSTFTHTNNWAVTVYPFVGLGFVQRSGIDPVTGRPGGSDTQRDDNDFQGHVGLQVNWNFSRGWSLFAEGRWYLLSNGFDGKTQFWRQKMLPVTVGVTRRFYESPFHRHTASESRNVNEDWFIGYGIGPNYSRFYSDKLNFGMVGVAPEIMFGRNFSNVWTLRLELTGFWGHERYDTLAAKPGDSYTFAMLHADLMFNIMPYINKSRGVRLGILPYLGAGPVWRFDNPTFTVGGDAGVMFRYYLGPIGDLFADMKYIMVPPRIGGTGAIRKGEDVYGVGFPSLTVGYIHNFGISTTRYRIPFNQML